MDKEALKDRWGTARLCDVTEAKPINRSYEAKKKKKRVEEKAQLGKQRERGDPQREIDTQDFCPRSRKTRVPEV